MLKHIYIYIENCEIANVSVISDICHPTHPFQKCQ